MPANSASRPVGSGVDARSLEVTFSPNSKLERLGYAMPVPVISRDVIGASLVKPANARVGCAYVEIVKLSPVDR